MWRNPITKRREVHFIPQAVEDFVGSKDFFKSREKGSVYKHQEKIAQACRNFAEIANSDREEAGEFSKGDAISAIWQCNLNNKKGLESHSYPGRKIVIEIGLVEALKDCDKSFGINIKGNEDYKPSLEEKIAAVVFHEGAHVQMRHWGRTKECVAFISVVFFVAKAALNFLLGEKLKIDWQTPLLGLMGRVVSMPQLSASEIAKYGAVVSKLATGALLYLVTSIALHSPSRQQEKEADRIAMWYLHRAKYDPRAEIWLQKFYADKFPPSGTGFLSQCLEGIYNLTQKETHTPDRAQALEDILPSIVNGTFKP